MNDIIRIGLRGIQELRNNIHKCETDMEYLDLHSRINNLNLCVIDEMLKEIGEREGENNHN